MKNIYLFISALFFLILFNGCSKDIDLISDNFDTVDSLLAEGWELYLQGQYQDALIKFEGATERDAANIESYIGRGWTNIRLNYFNQAKLELNMAINLSSEISDSISIADGYAGLYQIAVSDRFILETDPTLDPTSEEIDLVTNDAIYFGENILDYSPNYKTEHDPDFSAYEIHKSLAQLYFYLQRYQNSLEHYELMSQLIQSTNFIDNYITIQKSDTLTPWINNSGAIESIIFGETGTIQSINLNYSNVIRLNNIQDINNDVQVLDDMVDYLYQDKSIVIDLDYEFNTFTDTLGLSKISHAQPGEPASNYDILVTSKKGLIELESVFLIEEVMHTYYYRVDTTGTVADTTIADGIYDENDLCCYFYSEEIIEQAYTEIVDAEIWTSLDPDTNLPANPDNTIIPMNGLIYNSDFILIPGSNSEEYIYITTYKYGQYIADYETVLDFTEYLNLLNSEISIE